jgi:YkoY family integral membrane protein
VDHFLPSGLVIPSGVALGKSLALLPVLVALEAVLSADNAIALAAIARGLGDEERQRQALNIGLVAAFALRVLLIVTASWVTQFWQFELAGAGYLLWLSVQYFWPKSEAEEAEAGDHNRFESLWQAIPLIAVTDLAFSLDSVTTAIAVSKETWLVVTGGAIGVIMLRFMAGLFIRWLKEFEHLEDAGYVAVALVGLRLLLRVVDLVLPEFVMIALIMVIFAWGFSKRSVESTD